MSKYQFDLDKICNYLEPLKNKLPELFRPSNVKVEKLEELNVFSKEEMEEVLKLLPYEKEIQIKEAINVKLNETRNQTDRKIFHDICLWIVKDWGGIFGGKDDSTINIIELFLTSEKPSFERIASSSKVGSFMFPDKCIIYDSRVAYSLNWIILSETSSKYFFPIPEGRNSRMRAFELNVLIRLKYLNVYQSKSKNELEDRQYISKRDKQLYIPENEAYYELNELVKLINNRLWADDESKKSRLYFTEMLLFSIADKHIFNDITNRVKIEI